MQIHQLHQLKAMLRMEEEPILPYQSLLQQQIEHHILLEDLLHQRDVVDGRAVGQHRRALGQQRRAHELEHGVLRAGYADLPAQPSAALDQESFIRHGTNETTLSARLPRVETCPFI